MPVSRIRQSRPRDCERRKARSQRHFDALVPSRASSTSSPNESDRVDKSSGAYYREALAKARECIFSAPSGQLLGRAGRRCTLEDGERHALRAIAARPERAAEARLLLALSLVAQSRGREIEVPSLVVEALRATEAGALTRDDAVALVEAAGVAFERGAGATTGFASVELFVKAVSEAAAAAAHAGAVREAVEAAAAAVAARTEVAKERAQAEEAAAEREMAAERRYHVKKVKTEKKR